RSGKPTLPAAADAAAISASQASAQLSAGSSNAQSAASRSQSAGSPANTQSSGASRGQSAGSSSVILALRDRSMEDERAALVKELGIEGLLLGVGVDRVDYTKGILERFWAVERFLEKYPRYQGRFTFVQSGAPTRTYIKRYYELLPEADAAAARINWRFQTPECKTISLRNRHPSPRERARCYRATNL